MHAVSRVPATIALAREQTDRRILITHTSVCSGPTPSSAVHRELRTTYCLDPTAWTENVLTACHDDPRPRQCDLPAELQEQLQHQRRATSRSRATLFTKPSRHRIDVGPVSTFLSLKRAACDIFVATPVLAYLRRLAVPRPALPERGRQLAVSPASDCSPLSGHSRDSSHQRIPWRICSDFDRPVRAVIDVETVERVRLDQERTACLPAHNRDPAFRMLTDDLGGAGRKRKQGACHGRARTLPCGSVTYRARAVVLPVRNISLPWSLDARVKYTRP